MISQKGRYALRALLFIASRGDGATVQLSEILKHEKLPKKFMQFILLELRNSGLITSQRGRTGGYSLSRPASQINFADVLRITDGPLALTPCVSAMAYAKCEECFEETTCSIRKVLLLVRNATANILESCNLADATVADEA